MTEAVFRDALVSYAYGVKCSLGVGWDVSRDSRPPVTLQSGGWSDEWRNSARNLQPRHPTAKTEASPVFLLTELVHETWSPPHNKQAYSLSYQASSWALTGLNNISNYFLWTEMCSLKHKIAGLVFTCHYHLYVLLRIMQNNLSPHLIRDRILLSHNYKAKKELICGSLMKLFILLSEPQHQSVIKKKSAAATVVHILSF